MKEPPPRSYAQSIHAADDFPMRAIGRVVSPHLERHGTPRQAAIAADPTLRPDESARIELFANTIPPEALRDLEGFDYIWVLSVLHLNKGWRPKVVPPKGERIARGLFATRSPHRPNHIGLSAARIRRVDGLVIELERIDLLDGTPVLDIKPYVPRVDAFPDASSGWVE